MFERVTEVIMVASVWGVIILLLVRTVGHHGGLCLRGYYTDFSVDRQVTGPNRGISCNMIQLCPEI